MVEISHMLNKNGINLAETIPLPTPFVIQVEPSVL